MRRSIFKSIPLKYAVLTVLLLTAIFSATVFLFILWRNQRKVYRFEHAMNELAKGKIDSAEQKFANYLREDPNKELAYVKLAEIKESKRQWSEAALYWQAAYSLDSFRKDYKESELNALKKAGNYIQLKRELRALENSASNDHTLLLALCEYMTGKFRQAEKIYRKTNRKKTKNAPLERLVYALVNPEGRPPEEQNRILFSLVRNPDEFIAFEANNALAEFARRKKNFKREESFLQTASQKNPETGLLLLADFYHAQGRFADAADVYETIRKKRNATPELLVRIAENSAAMKDREALKRLSGECDKGGREWLTAGYYIDSLLAFLEGDSKKMTESFRLTEGRYRGIPAQMIGFYSAVIEGNPGKALEFLKDLNPKALPPEMLFKINSLAADYVRRIAEKHPETALKIAKELYNPLKPELIFAKLIAEERFQKGILTDEELSRLRKDFPREKMFLDFSILQALQSGRSEDALVLALAARKKAPRDPRYTVTLIAALENLKRIPEAENEYRNAMPIFGNDAEFTKQFLLFSINRGRKTSLEKLSEFLGASKRPEYRALKPFADAALAGLAKNKPEMIRNYKNAAKENWNPEKQTDFNLLFRAAFSLAVCDELDSAVSLYETLRKKSPGHELLLLNLSELYAKQGRKDDALAAAETVWKKHRQWDSVREAYGIRLAESGRHRDAVKILTPLIARNTAVLAVWTAEMEILLRTATEQGDRKSAVGLARRILEVLPDNQLGRNTLKRYGVRR